MADGQFGTLSLTVVVGAVLGFLAIARRVGVAVETVYSGFGSKKHVLRAVLEFAGAGMTIDQTPRRRVSAS